MSKPATPRKAKDKEPVKRASPMKSKKPLLTPQKKSNLRVVCYSFAEDIPFEIYLYEKSDNEDGYTAGLAKYLRQEFDESHTLIDECNFIRTLNRRRPNTNDGELTNPGEKYARKVFLRQPKSGETTPETRQAGLNAFRSFVMDSRFSKYPPQDVDVVDKTDYAADPPISMDDFLMNADIDFIVQHCFDEAEWNDAFKERYPGLAETMWKHEHVTDFARRLGW